MKIIFSSRAESVQLAQPTKQTGLLLFCSLPLLLSGPRVLGVSFPQIPLSRVRCCAAGFPPLPHSPSGHLSAFHHCCRAAPPECTPPQAHLSSRAPPCCTSHHCPCRCRCTAAMPRAGSSTTSPVPRPPCWHRARASTWPPPSSPRARIDPLAEKHVLCTFPLCGHLGAVSPLRLTLYKRIRTTQRSCASRHHPRPLAASASA
jgi:hypothetical protein